MKKNRVNNRYVVVGVVMLCATLVLFIWRVTRSDGSVAGYRDTPFEVVVEESVDVESAEAPSVFTRVVSALQNRADEVKSQYSGNPTVVYPVPFTSQAPDGNWEPPFDEACEEASMLMVYSYLAGKTLNPTIARESILDQVAWQTEQGYAIDLTAAETVAVAQAYFGMESFLEYNPTVESMEQHIEEGSLLIVPAAGRLLNNPYFTAPGPLYHMFVIRGYDQTKRRFISNDPGTRRGDGFAYSYDTVMNAMHDWNGGDVMNGQKVIIVVPQQSVL